MTNEAESFLGPEAIIMMFIAITLDLVGLICTILIILFGIGEILSWISDAVGIFVFGFWLVFRIISKKVEEKLGLKEEAELKELSALTEVSEKAIKRRQELSAKIKKIRGTARKATKAGLRKGVRSAITVIGEIIPLIGTLPFWTWFVYSEIKEQ